MVEEEEAEVGLLLNVMLVRHLIRKLGVEEQSLSHFGVGNLVAPFCGRRKKQWK